MWIYSSSYFSMNEYYKVDGAAYLKACLQIEISLFGLGDSGFNSLANGATLSSVLKKKWKGGKKPFQTC